MGLVIATIIVIVAIATFIAQEPAIFSLAYWQDGGSNTSRSEVVRNLGLLVAGLVGLGVGTWRAFTAYYQTKASQKQADAANEQARIAEQGHITDRYARAVEMLSSDNARSRTGAVYALARIAQDSVERDHVPIMAVLSEFVCNPPYTTETKLRADARRGGHILPAIQCPDIKAALRSLIQRNAAQKAHEASVGVRVGFPRANLRELDLERAHFTGAFLSLANLTGANLELANLTGANLTFACLDDADITLGTLTNAKLSHVDEFDGAKFLQTNLTGADFSYANLTGANLRGADLTDADLTDADLTGVENLTQQQLDSAVCDPKVPPKLPPGLVHPRRPAVPKDENDKPLSEL